MKTNYFSSKSASIYSLIGLLTIVMTSCSSYQNTTNDSDGIYNNPQRNNGTAQNNNQNSGYFASLQDDPEFFTDTENYSSTYGDEARDTVYVTETGYGGWGSNPEGVTVNYYDNGWGYNNWYGPGLGWGWGGWNSWYGGYGGWGYGGWGLGWGWNSPYYGGWGYGGYGYGYGGWNNWYGNGY